MTTWVRMTMMTTQKNLISTRRPKTGAEVSNDLPSSLVYVFLILTFSWGKVNSLPFTVPLTPSPGLKGGRGRGRGKGGRGMMRGGRGRNRGRGRGDMGNDDENNLGDMDNGVRLLHCSQISPKRPDRKQVIQSWLTQMAASLQSGAPVPPNDET